MTDLLVTVGDLTITDRFYATRSMTESLASPLSAEDQTIQSMADVSPTKWHRAHTTWFFETFLLTPNLAGYRSFHPDFAYLFNSYYEGVGARYPRHDRGQLSRPGINEIAEYRAHVDHAMATLLEDPACGSCAGLV
ncbi:MAG TPA: DinB family protein, partial [Acidimicrobiales bacterium]|nr:DinB family protein [Acidimicrobiales bacterium]